MQARYLELWFFIVFLPSFPQVKHGNEDTLREMLRIKRSVQATYNTQVCSARYFALILNRLADLFRERNHKKLKAIG
jgi:hypothetical protein